MIVGIIVLVIGVLSFVIVRKSRMLVISIFMFGIESEILMFVSETQICT